ncbi:MAG: DUF4294 domain-containing protein [Paludibacteraceae bacterium]|nr:DUF4294 domain-containing protein [Paludibacteraceae bacterium]
MSRKTTIILPLLWLICTVSAAATIPGDSALARLTTSGDTMYLAFLKDVYVYPKMVFKNKRQERFYWRTVRDVKKTLPFAKLIAADMVVADAELAKLNTKKERKRWWRQYERYLFRKYENEFRNMTASQGQMLMKLMDRESDKTSYELIRYYRGKVSADFWQFVAKLFRNDLKEGYDGNDKDQIIERVINLVEAGQL